LVAQPGFKRTIVESTGFKRTIVESTGFKRTIVESTGFDQPLADGECKDQPISHWQTENAKTNRSTIGRRRMQRPTIIEDRSKGKFGQKAKANLHKSNHRDESTVTEPTISQQPPTALTLANCTEDGKVGEQMSGPRSPGPPGGWLDGTTPRPPRSDLR
jgi:hypothetical protein